MKAPFSPPSIGVTPAAASAFHNKRLSQNVMTLSRGVTGATPFNKSNLNKSGFTYRKDNLS